eukprot:TRINITY_DN66165_c0_g1_i1.p2 TRINITY_DN66165_c0_g1~~TRINITY_DN66165_c0_g1_i1.p2  ORF type:complete len:112 (-),score=12.16 TRINITY_DN66165_c0_g1_i1:23-358(-)
MADTGLGMSQEFIDTLWDDNLSTKEHGSGIGLQAIKRIADEHLAEIEVKSEKGLGSEFVFKFPNSIVSQKVNTPSKEQENIFTNKDRVNKPLAGQFVGRRRITFLVLRSDV